MSIRRMIRESAFKLARNDVASFLADHEEDLVAIFREEMADLDERLPEEQLFIDIRMVPLGEAILRAALHAITRFLTEDDFSPRAGETVRVPVKSDAESRTLTLKDRRSN